MFEIIAGNGLGEEIRVSTTRSELADLMRDALWQGVIASNAIEGIRVDDIEKPTDLPLPDIPIDIPLKS